MPELCQMVLVHLEKNYSHHKDKKPRMWQRENSVMVATKYEKIVGNDKDDEND